MKKFLAIMLTAAFCSTQADWKDSLKQSAQTVAQNSDYKDLLSKALNAAVSELSSSGFLNNATAKIPLPSGLQTAANLAKKVGGEKWANEMISSINAAATKAVGGAAGVFSDTIKNMSQNDVKSLFNGGNDGITQFLRKKSGSELIKVFKPIIEDMMSRNSFANAYNGLNSLVSSSSAVKQAKGLASNFGIDLGNDGEDLNDYITRKTLDGLFNVMSEKESSLRGGAVEQGTKILQGIFK